MSSKNREKVSIISWIIRRIRNRYMRRKIKWRQFKEARFKLNQEELSLEKQRAIDLFIALLKNKNSSLNHSPESRARFIESDFAWACMCSAKDGKNYIINIIDESLQDNPHSHEFLIPDDYANKIMDVFDSELEKRFKALDIEKKKVLVSDIDKLIIRVKEIR